jgi:hypothetical protein
VTAEHTTRCLRCARPIRSARSLAAGYGPGCRARIRAAALAEAVKDFSAAQIDKARELIADGGLIATKRPGVFRAVSSDGTRTYLVHRNIDNCPNGLRGKGSCYHVAAARILTAR